MSPFPKCVFCGKPIFTGKCTNTQCAGRNIKVCDTTTCSVIKIVGKELGRLKADIEAAEVSLDKFFDKEPETNLATKASDVREMYCKLGDENESLREDIKGLQIVFDLGHLRMKEATVHWRRANCKPDTVMPDLGDLLTWLMEQAGLRQMTEYEVKANDTFEKRQKRHNNQRRP